MENRGIRRNCSSGDMFSFPIPDSDQPGSPNSPADHLFFNGKLLPLSFPIPTPNSLFYSRSTSRTSSKDSLMSSRSNSRSSSARTSTSEAASERKLIISSCNDDFGRSMSGRRERKKPAVSYHYESSRRRQLFAAAPVLKQQGSRSLRKAKILERNGNKKSSSGGVDSKDSGATKSWSGWNVLKLFVSACQECHAIKT
ncbi:hypothetical protein ACS0TY_018618 [Phlomoides rotata]